MIKQVLMVLLLLVVVHSNAQFSVTRLASYQDKTHWKKEAGQGVMRIFLSRVVIEGTGTGILNKISYNYNGTHLNDLDSIWVCESDQWSNPKEILMSIAPTSDLIEASFINKNITSTQYYVIYAFISPDATIDHIVDIELTGVTIDDVEYTTIEINSDRYLTIKQNADTEIIIDAADLRSTLENIEVYGVPPGGTTIIVNDDTESTNGMDLNTTFLAGRHLTIKRSNTGTKPPLIRYGVNYGGIMKFEGVNNVTFDGIDFQATRDDAKYGIIIDEWAKMVFCKNLVIKNSTITMMSTNTNFSSSEMKGSAIALYNDNGTLTKHHSQITFENNNLSDGMCGIFLKGNANSMLSDIKILGNTITRMQHYGIYVGKDVYAENLMIEGNTIGNFSVDHSNNGGEVQGIGFDDNNAIRDTASIVNNYIFDIKNNNADCYRVRGIDIGNPLGGVLVANNMIYNISAPNSNRQDGDNSSRPSTVAGIFTSGLDNNSSFYIYHNTVVIDYTSNQENNRSTAFEAEKIQTEVPVYLANNIFINNSDLTASTNNYCYAIFTSDETGSFSNLQQESDNNLYVSPNGFIAGQSNDPSDGNDDAQFATLNEYKTEASPRDASALTEDIAITIPFKDIDNGDLTINSATTSSVVKGGMALPVVSTDYEGEPRSETAPYIGADEYNNNTVISVSATEVSEEGETFITIVATAMDNVSGVQTISLIISGENVTPGDYTLSSSDLTIADGTKTGSVTFTAIDDDVIELTETAVISAEISSSGITLLNSSVELAIINNDFPAVNLSVSETFGTETDQTEITITATAEQSVYGNQEMDVSVSGMGITAEDYQLSANKITINDGESTGTVTFAILDDNFVESIETATITINNFTSGIEEGTTVSQEISIESEDNPVVDLMVSVTSGTEADETQVTLTVSASAPVIGAQSVDLSVSGTGITSEDYQLSNTTFSFSDGSESSEITLTITNDSDPEGTENIELILINPSVGLELGTYMQSVQISDDDVTYLSLSADKTSVNESDANTTVTLTITGNRNVIGAQTVDLEVSGSNISTDDYSLSQTTVNFADGENQKEITLQIENDTYIEPVETLTVRLTNPSQGLDIDTESVDIELYSDDKPEVTLTLSTGIGTEADQTEITITALLSEAAIGNQKVDIEVTGAKSESFHLANLSLAFSEGVTVSSTTFTVIDDDIIEIEDEIATITLVNLSSGLIAGTEISGTITIVDNEEPLPVVTLTVETDSVNEKNEDIIRITAITDKPVIGDQSLQLALVGTATLFEDCIFTSNTILIPDQSSEGTTSMVIIDDDIVEHNEIIEIMVTFASGGIDITNTAQVSVKIIDDETTGINESFSHAVEFYPNPVKYELIIDKIEHLDLVKIMNVQGKILKTVSVRNDGYKVIQTDDLPAGVYNLQFVSISGNVTNEIIIKQ